MEVGSGAGGGRGRGPSEWYGYIRGAEGVLGSLITSRNEVRRQVTAHQFTGRSVF